jgi:tetratricopeptide (TPR) repeat protein
MELAYRQRSDWLLLLDADMVLETKDDLHDVLSGEARCEIFLVDVMGDDTELPLPMSCLVRGNRHWKFDGVAHEVLTTAGRPRPGRLPTVRVHHFADGWSSRDKYERDRRLLEAEHERAPEDPRTLFYLAQTYRDLGHIDSALSHYSKRAAMDSAEAWDEETFYALYQVGVLQAESDWPAAVDALLRAWSFRPTRAEPLYHLAFGWRNRGAWPAAYLFASRGVHIPQPNDILFVDKGLYRWGLRFERSVAAWYIGEKDLARAYTEELLIDPELPEQWRVYAEENRRVGDA